ncbi:hypothetical protein [Pseudoduganella namucuonensis]|uniref:HAMP domain-containing protein n=1 Tax=Pseudoduganella namucuonensis TaxID=1035707 RepID=A0A1I7L4S2_9BURK|nr:hypothetical protein [Pseudoduganella namucuonensis]SFV04645.1 hypothetical protein SAMN05216552_102323 [Pseudoduganella namucuonensis]
MAMSRLSVTITAPIVLISVLAIGLTVFLNVGKLDRTLAELEESRLRYTVNALRQNLETGLDLGLPVRSLGNAQAAIDFEASQDPDIVSIVVRDEAGQPVFHTSRPAADGRGADADPDSIKVGATLSNNLGAEVGAIELRYSRRGHDEFIAGISAHLLLAALVATAVSILLTLVVTRQWVRRIGRTLGSIEHALDDNAPAVEKPDRHAAALAEEVKHSAGKAMDELDRARRAVGGAP